MLDLMLRIFQLLMMEGIYTWDLRDQEISDVDLLPTNSLILSVQYSLC